MTRFATLAVCVALAGACGERSIEWGLPDGGYWPDLRGYPGVGQGRILSTNNFGDTVSILDLAAVGTPDLREIARVPVGLNPVEREGPHHLTVDPSGEHYYVGISNFVPAAGSGPHGAHGSGTAPGHVLKIRAADNVQVGTARVERNPGDIRLTPDGRLLLMSHFDILLIAETLASGGDPANMNAALVILDPVTLVRLATVPLCPAPHGVGISADSRWAYVSCFDDHMAVVKLEPPWDNVTRIPVLAAPGTVENPLCEPYAMTVSPVGDSVWVSCFGDGRVLRYDVAAGAMDATAAIDVGGRAVFGTFTADGKTLYLPHQDPDGVAIIDPAARTITATVALPRPACQNAHAVKLTDDERWLLVVCEGNHATPGSLVVVDTASRAMVNSVPLGVFPDDVQILRAPK